MENTAREKLIAILADKIGAAPEKLNAGNDLEPLTGPVFGLNARDLTYLFLEAEKEFRVKLSIDQIKAYEFNTIAGITRLIESHALAD